MAELEGSLEQQNVGDYLCDDDLNTDLNNDFYPLPNHETNDNAKEENVPPTPKQKQFPMNITITVVFGSSTTNFKSYFNWLKFIGNECCSS
jgi:hypothetical protein